MAVVATDDPKGIWCAADDEPLSFVPEVGFVDADGGHVVQVQPALSQPGFAPRQNAPSAQLGSRMMVPLEDQGAFGQLWR